MSLPEPALLLVTDRGQARRPLVDIVDRACAAGCRWISLREKDLAADEQLALARELLAVVRRHGARLTLHGDPRLARAAGIDGVHLAAGGDPAAARAALGAAALIGLSVHGATDLAPASAADYVVAGPAFASASKPGYGPPLGAAGLGAIARASLRPVVAIGGVTPLNARSLIDAGATGVAVMGSVMRAADPTGEVRALIEALRCRGGRADHRS